MNVRLSFSSLLILTLFSTNYSMGGSAGASRFLQTDHTITHQIELSEATQQMIKDLEDNLSKRSRELRSTFQDATDRLTRHPIKTTVEIELTEKTLPKAMATLSRIDELLRTHLDKIDSITDKPLKHQIHVAHPDDIKDIFKTGGWYIASTGCCLTGLYIFSQGVLSSLDNQNTQTRGHYSSCIGTATIGALVVAVGAYALLHHDSFIKGKDTPVHPPVSLSNASSEKN